MKKIFKSFIALAMIAGFASCEDEQDLQFLSPEGEFRILSPTSGDSVELSPATPLNPGIALSWEAFDYGTPTEVTYTVQIAENGTDFAAPIDLISTATTYASVNSEALNGSAIAAGLQNDVFGTLDVRVRATVGNGSEPVYSDVINYSVKPYVTYPFRDLYLVGNASQDNWNNNSNNYPLFRDAANEDVYHYTGYFNAGSFKLLEVKGQWQPQWGQNAGVLAVNDGTGSDPNTFDIATAGYYSVVVDLAAGTYSIDPYDASGAATYSTIGIIGTSTPGAWDSDTDMTQSSFDPHMWYINNQLLTSGGEMKFRANDAWDVNWGSADSYSGLGDLGGGNIQIGIPTDGNYDIWFNDITGRYIYIPVN
jgi:hypothetical protein